ncbi:MAG: sigma 54-interacting transcriptional regulator [Lachnospirales bacterium]
MNGVSFFSSEQDVYEIAKNIIEENNDDSIILKLVKIEDTVKTAMEVISQGVSIIIANGRQAEAIKKYTNAIVVEPEVYFQELALLILKAKKIKVKNILNISIFYWGDVICDTTLFNEIFDVNLKMYKLDNSFDWRNEIINNVDVETDVVVGSIEVTKTVETIENINFLSLVLSLSYESIKKSIESANIIYKTNLSNEHNEVRFNTVLENSTSGILKINSEGTILVANPVIEQIFTNVNDIIGKNLIDVLVEIDSNELKKILEGTLENYSTVIKYRAKELTITIEAIKLGNIVTEAIVVCNVINKINTAEKEVMRELYLKGKNARLTFDDIDKNMSDLKRIAEKAKVYAMSSSPVLIEAVSGPELELIVQGIHNYSMRKNAPFISINLAGMVEEEQERALFGTSVNGEDVKGAIEKAKYGTLVIKSIDRLTLRNQYRLISCIRSKYLTKNNDYEDIVLVDTRIIACCGKDLAKLREKFLFRSDLYFKLRSLRLRIPKLTERKSDVAFLLDTYIQKYMKHYSKFHILTAGAKRALLEYEWQGNSIQLDAFCERLILTLNRRSITEGYVKSLLDELYHTPSSIYNESDLKVENFEEIETLSEIKDIDPFQEVLIKTLSKYNGNRTLTAKELKISTTTLWRKIKMYNLDGNS